MIDKDKHKPAQRPTPEVEVAGDDTIIGQMPKAPSCGCHAEENKKRPSPVRTRNGTPSFRMNAAIRTRLARAVKARASSVPLATRSPKCRDFAFFISREAIRSS